MIKKNKSLFFNEKGITLLALVIMVIVIAILATVATYTGLSTYNNMQVTAFIKRLETVEERVRTLNQRAEVDSLLSENIGKYGQSLDEVTEAKTTFDILKGKKDINDEEKPLLDSDDESQYKYFSNKNLKDQLDISDIEGSYIINFETNEVFSVQGIDYGGKTVYCIDEIRD